MSFPPRYPWDNFPDVQILTSESLVKKHSDYHAAKSGDADSAISLVRDLAPLGLIHGLREIYFSSNPILVSAHAYEADGVNAIPAALAEYVEELTGFTAEMDVVQVNVVGHTSARGWHRMSHQAKFDGTVCVGSNYILIDDFIGQGGTLANLRGYILSKGGFVVGATVLTGRADSSKIKLEPETLQRLRAKHGQQLESWWQIRFGHGLNCLTESEARYLEKVENFERIRDRIVEAEQG